MTDYILWSLKDGHLTLKELKSKISYHFGKWLNLSITADSELKTWEKTLLKKLGKCNGVISTPTYFAVN